MSILGAGGSFMSAETKILGNKFQKTSKQKNYIVVLQCVGIEIFKLFSPLFCAPFGCNHLSFASSPSSNLIDMQVSSLVLVMGLLGYEKFIATVIDDLMEHS